MSVAAAIEGLSFDYGDFRALDDVSAELRAGAITALVGPNGAGKTTLMRCVAGLARPVIGRVRTLGVDVTHDARAVRAQVGYLPDFIGLYNDLTVRRCLSHAAARQGLRGDAEDEAVEWAIDALDLEPLAQQRAGALSRGQRQRTAIGMAIIHQPALLILDEPASGLDPEAREALADLLRRLRDELGATLLVSSHILAELDAYAEDVMILDRGRLVETGAVEDGPAAEWVSVETAGAFDLAAIAPDGVTIETIADNRFRLRCPAEATEQAAILRGLINAGAPVATFAPARESLQEVYVARMKAARARGDVK